MPITATCPKCQKEYRVKDDVVGKKFRCKACQAVVTVPEAAADPGGHKDPWDDLDLDAYGDNPYAETDEPIEAPRARKKSPSKKKRSRSSGMPGTVIAAIACESILLLLRAVGLVGAVVTLDPCNGVFSLMGVMLSGGAIYGYIQGINVIRWISVVLCGIGMLWVLSCTLLGVFGGFAMLEEQGNIPAEQLAFMQGIMGIVIAVMIAVLVFYGVIMGCLLTPSANDHFRN
ncbi:MAG: hypothetical protein DWQ29_11070 [Planctomycetota bacterium]|nr:MAG: hypothetical protein DWQ29_11070 [Planctomycetota bacterium]